MFRATVLLLVFLILSPVIAIALEGLTLSRKTIQPASRTVIIRDPDGKEREETIRLKPLLLGTSVLVNNNSAGDADSTVIPIIEAAGNIAYNDPESKKLNFYGDVKLSLRPEPSSSSVEDVSQIIRAETGTISFDAGGIWQYFLKTHNNPEGPIGIDLRCAVKLSYQRARSIDTDDAEYSDGLSEFGILTPEIRAGIMLKYIYFGYKCSYNITFGSETDLSDEIDESYVQKFILITSIDTRTTDSAGNKEEYYIEVNYTGSRNSLNDGSFGIAITRTFNTFW